MKKYFKILLVLIMFMAMPVFALSGDLFRADDSVNVTEEMNGSSFFAGNSVDVDSKINGILFAAGNSVTTAGESDYAFIAGNNIVLNDQKFKDGFIAGSTISIDNVTIERDAYVVGSTVKLNGTIGRNIYIGSGKVNIKGTINGDATIYAEEIIIEDGATINGTLKYPEDADLTVSESATIGKTIKEKANSLDFSSKKASFINKLTSNLLSLLNVLLIGLVLMLIMPNVFKKIAEFDEKKIISSLGFGFITLIAAPLAAIILMTTLVGMSTGLILLAVYVISIYLSTVFASYYISNLIFKNKINNKFLIYLLGAVIVFVLKLIPFISILTSICILFIGLGLIVNLIFNRK